MFYDKGQTTNQQVRYTQSVLVINNFVCLRENYKMPLNAEIWEQGDIAKKRSKMGQESQAIRRSQFLKQTVGGLFHHFCHMQAVLCNMK